MRLQQVGCSHRSASIAVREQIAFSAEQARQAFAEWRRKWPHVEAALVSTCNRVELYVAAECHLLPTFEQLAGFLAEFHGLAARDLAAHLDHREDEEVVRHLFAVAAGLESMVVGEPQILSQVKQSYALATEENTVGPILHAAFQSAVCVARRVSVETAIQQRRVSIPSVAVAEFAKQIFERFDDKEVLVVGAGEMAEETLRYLQDEGVASITVVNRSRERAESLADRWHGKVAAWDRLADELARADLVVSTTGANETVVGRELFESIEAHRGEKPLFVLDLAVPRDFDPAIGERPGVYLYSIDDLQAACQANRRARDKELPAALRIVEQEAERFMRNLHHHATGPLIRRLQQSWEGPKNEEIDRLFHKLPELDPRAREEIRQAFDRLVNKLMHPPLDSLREEARNGTPHGLLDALAKLFQIRD